MISFDQNSIGTIVCLKTHPYTNSSSQVENNAILFAGEPLLISPLMVVTEILVNNKYTNDENTGMSLTDTKTLQCKCIWYSSTNGRFEEEWFSSKLLKVIDNTPHEINLSSSTSFSLKTLALESQKLKSSLSLNSVQDDGFSKITALLSFVPPIMQFVGTTKSESKDPLFDSKTNERKRYISKLNIKLRYFNCSSDKFSEFLIPQEALIQLPIISEKKLQSVQKQINSKKMFSLAKLQQTEALTETETNINSNISLIQLKKINHKFGSFYVDIYDFVNCRRDQILLDEEENQFLPVSESSFTLPKFEIEKNKINVKKISKENIEEELKIFQKSLLGAYDEKNVYFKIKYQARDGKYTDRIVSNCEFLVEDIKEIDENSELKTEISKSIYLKAYCYLRKSNRYFKLDNIEELEAFYM